MESMRVIDMKYEHACPSCRKVRMLSYSGFYEIRRGKKVGKCGSCGTKGIKHFFKKPHPSWFKRGESHHNQPHSPESRELIKLNTPVRRGIENNRYIDGRSSKRGYKTFLENKRRSLKRGNGGSHSYEEWESLKGSFNNTCPMCRKVEPYISLGKDHIVPISKGGTDDISN